MSALSTHLSNILSKKNDKIFFRNWIRSYQLKSFSKSFGWYINSSIDFQMNQFSSRILDVRQEGKKYCEQQFTKRKTWIKLKNVFKNHRWNICCGYCQCCCHYCSIVTRPEGELIQKRKIRINFRISKTTYFRLKRYRRLDHWQPNPTILDITQLQATILKQSAKISEVT